VSSGGSQTSNHTASNPPAVVVGKGNIRIRKGIKVGLKKRRKRRTRTAGYATADNAGHRHARIEQFGLLLWLDFDTGESTHLTHFATNLLYAGTRIQFNFDMTRKKGAQVTSVSKWAS